MRIYLHFVWATWDRLPLITPDIREDIYRIILAKCEELGAHPLALGGVADHVHLLARLPSTLAPAKLVGEVKGASSHAVTHQGSQRIFKWQGAYGAFSVSERTMPTVQHYIQHQAEHHQDLAACPEYHTMEQESPTN